MNFYCKNRKDEINSLFISDSIFTSLKKIQNILHVQYDKRVSAPK